MHRNYRQIKAPAVSKVISACDFPPTVGGIFKTFAINVCDMRGAFSYRQRQKATQWVRPIKPLLSLIESVIYGLGKRGANQPESDAAKLSEAAVEADVRRRAFRAKVRCQSGV